MRRKVLFGTALAAVLAASPAMAQWSGSAVQAQYNSATVNLNNGAFNPLQIDQNGNLKVDCITGCGGGGGTSSTAAQGTPAAIANAWPVYLSYNGVALGSSSLLSLPTTDSQDGVATNGSTMPTGGSGLLGWLSAVYTKLVSGIGTTDTADGTNPTTPVFPLASGGQGLLGWLGTIAGELGASGGLKVADPNNANYSVWPTITANNNTYTPVAGTRAIAVNCTTAAVIVMSDGTNSMTWNVPVGSSTLTFMPASFTMTSGAATFYGVK